MATVFNKEQSQAIAQTDGPLLIIAGAGSGKTTVLTHRTANIIQKGVLPQQILMLTFTKKAAEEMKDRGERLIGPDFQNITACTYHSLCAKILRQHANAIGISRSFAIMTSDEELWDLMLGKSDDAVCSEDNDKFPSSATLSNVFSLAFNKNKSIREIIREQYPTDIPEEYIPSIEKLKAEGEAYKRKHSWMTYDDLMEKTIELLSGNKEIRDEFANTYQYIMVDEYQDSNMPQLSLLKLLCGDKEKPNICAVGDDQQSIYLFRGSEFMNIINFPKEFQGCNLIILDKNYRSNQEILDVANSIIADAPEKFPKTMQGTWHKDELPVIPQTQTVMDENAFILHQIQRTHKDGVPWKEIAVLARTGRITIGLEAVLNGAKIPYDKYGGQKISEMRFVRDIIFLFKSMMDFSDEVSWFWILQLLPGVARVNALKIYQKIKAASGVAGVADKAFEKRKHYQYQKDFAEKFENFHLMDFHQQYQYLTKYYWELRELQLALKAENKRTK